MLYTFTAYRSDRSCVKPNSFVCAPRCTHGAFLPPRERGGLTRILINAYVMSAVNVLYALLFAVLLVAERTPAFEGAWAMGSAVAAAYKALALYAVFARHGRRLFTALMALAATATAIGIQVVLMNALGSQ